MPLPSNILNNTKFFFFFFKWQNSLEIQFIYFTELRFFLALFLALVYFLEIFWPERTYLLETLAPFGFGFLGNFPAKTAGFTVASRQSSWRKIFFSSCVAVVLMDVPRLAWRPFWVCLLCFWVTCFQRYIFSVFFSRVSYAFEMWRFFTFGLSIKGLLRPIFVFSRHRLGIWGKS